MSAKKVGADEAVLFVTELLKRYQGITFELLKKAIIPLRLELAQIDDTTFQTGIEREIVHLVPGRTGKIAPKRYLSGLVPWREILKARITDSKGNRVSGEFYMMHKSDLRKGLKEVQLEDFFEMDRFGVTSKLESALTEMAFVDVAQEQGYSVQKMPDNLAIDAKKYLERYLKQVGLPKAILDILEKDTRAKGWPNFDFLIGKGNILKRVEVKSLWGTDTSKARLIHSLGGRWKTSSCRFEDQDLFAVNLWLRTGNIRDFAFAPSILRDNKHLSGLPAATSRTAKGKVFLDDYVHQNPDCEVGNGSWFATLDEVVELI
ncbi:MAG: hypothetical protein OEZ48_03690 [Candidatus Bathyarchaeota archaeon]|nr:hypothetical protein [Candidatus Bathyarchaeota archaeon]MDH5686951.1 hypothetical protein [Candidatus Bathyarchaeota archaeon]